VLWVLEKTIYFCQNLENERKELIGVQKKKFIKKKKEREFYCKRNTRKKGKEKRVTTTKEILYSTAHLTVEKKNTHNV
jgi:hypothetical protein